MPSFGLHLTTFPDPAGPVTLAAHVREVTATLEATGTFGSLWLTDHVRHLGPEGPTRPMPEAHVLLGAVGATTTRLRLGVLAASVVYRRPALLAKMVTTLDVLSGGRAVLGIGAGHPRTESEHREYGYEFPPLGERMAMLDDALTTIRPMIGSAPDPDAPSNWPRPVNPAGIPVLVAGSGEQRLLRIAAKHADLINLSFPSGDRLARVPHKLDVLAEHCATIGRDPSALTVTYKGMCAIAPSRNEARAMWERWRQPRGIGDVDQRDGVFVGEPGDIAEQVQPFLDAGIEHLIVEFAGGTDPKSIALAAEALAPLAGGLQ
jgi:alkanesulfonate monooxygenase SsuD/methylene tetrahydromethanopterin reductase-like flavin-dependent oxidoreductase (luciferase family)